MNRLLVVLVVTIVVASSCSQKYYIVRHAEKEAPAGASSMMSNDPPLSGAGKVRALVLKDLLKGQHIRYIFSTNTLRTLSTAAPLSQANGIKPALYNSKDSLSQFIGLLKSIKKGNMLIVGHSNTVDDLVNQLCNSVKINGDLADTDYDNIFIVTRKGKKMSFRREKFGYPSNPEK